jgi:hypothetical protein
MTTHYFDTTARGRLVDDLLQLKAKGTVATSMVGEDPVGTDKYYDTGGGHTKGDVVINVYAVPNILASTKFTMRLQGSKNSSFTTINDLVITELGDSTQISGGSDLTTGRYIVPFSNAFDGVCYRYLRHYITLGGTCGTGIQYECYLSNLNS